MLRNVIVSDGPTLWMLYVASCDGLQKVQEHKPSLFACIIQWLVLIAYVHAVRLALQGCGDRFSAPVASWLLAANPHDVLKQGGGGHQSAR